MAKLKVIDTAIEESTLKALVNEVLGLLEYSEEKMDAVMEKAVIADNTMTFHFKDGHTESRRYQNKKKGCPHIEEYKAYMSQCMKEKWTPERRKRMSEKAKQIRKERGEHWRKEK